MDAVVGALQSPKAIYAASKLSYFDRMKNEGQSQSDAVVASLFWLLCFSFGGFGYSGVTRIHTNGVWAPQSAKARGEKKQDVNKWCRFLIRNIDLFQA